MKKSLLSKLLAGVMSLGMVTGGRNFVSNNIIAATEVDYEDEDDTEDNKSGKDVNSRYSLEFIVKNMINPVWGKAIINKGSMFASTGLYALALAKGAVAASNEIDVKNPVNVEEKAKIIGKNLGIAHLGAATTSTALWLMHVDTVLDHLGFVAI